MSSERDDYDSDAPEELTVEQGVQQDEELRRIQKENKARVVHEGKERRRLWAQRKTPRPPKEKVNVQDVVETEIEKETETHQEPLADTGMLPSNIVQLLAAREKQVFLSDSEDEGTAVKPTHRKKKRKSSGVDTVILKDIDSAQCLQSSLEFLKKKKMQVSRSMAVLNNSNQALRLISSAGLLNRK